MNLCCNFTPGKTCCTRCTRPVISGIPVLAWLPDKALSFEYAQYVFPTGLPSPVAGRRTGVVNPLQRADRFGRVVLEMTRSPVTFYRYCSRVTRRHWSTSLTGRRNQMPNIVGSVLNDSAWALLNVAREFPQRCRGCGGSSAQAIDQIQQAPMPGIGVTNSSNGPPWRTCCWRLEMILSHHAAMARKRPSSTPGIERLPLDRASRPRSQARHRHFQSRGAGAGTCAEPLRLAGRRRLGCPGARRRAALGAYLDTFKVVAPDLSSEQVTTVRPAPPHIYQHDNRNYARGR